MRKILPGIFWFVLTFSTLIFVLSFYALSPISKNAPNVQGVTTRQAYEYVEPEPILILPPFETSLVSRDARPKIVSAFLSQYNCPLTPYDSFADKYVEIADKYHLDFRLIPAISMQESSCCKKIPEGSNNCWGYGIYGDQVVIFPSVELGIEAVAKTLAKNYTSKGLMEPEEIMKKYTPQSKGSWAAGVLHFMYEMK
jgi:hypothetical protein